MTRTSGGATAETAAAANRAALFARFNFSSGNVDLWSGIGELTTGAVGSLPATTWTGAGTLGAVSPIEETSGLRANGVVCTLSGVSVALLAIALGEHYQGRAAKLWLGYFDASWALIADPVMLVNGKMDQMELADNGALATIKVSVENRLIDFERPADPGLYTPEDQKRRFPGDLGLDYVPRLQQKVIYWGRESLKPKKAEDTGGGPTPGDVVMPHVGGGGGSGNSGLDHSHGGGTGSPAGQGPGGQ